MHLALRSPDSIVDPGHQEDPDGDAVENANQVIHGLRLVPVRCGGGVGTFDLDQFRPDALPIVGAKVLTGDRAASRSFDCSASLHRDRLQTARPLRDHDGVDAECGCNPSSGAAGGRIEEGSDVHVRYISSRLSEMLALGQFHFEADGYGMRSMPTIEDIRRTNLLLVIDQFRTIQAFANAVERSHSQISQIRNGLAHSATGKTRQIGSPIARDFERRLNLPDGWMDQLHDVDGVEEMQAIVRYIAMQHPERAQRVSLPGGHALPKGREMATIKSRLKPSDFQQPAAKKRGTYDS